VFPCFSDFLPSIPYRVVGFSTPCPLEAPSTLTVWLFHHSPSFNTQDGQISPSLHRPSSLPSLHHERRTNPQALAPFPSPLNFMKSLPFFSQPCHSGQASVYQRNFLLKFLFFGLRPVFLLASPKHENTLPRPIALFSLIMYAGLTEQLLTRPIRLSLKTPDDPGPLR